MTEQQIDGTARAAAESALLKKIAGLAAQSSSPANVALLAQAYNHVVSIEAEKPAGQQVF